jgi:hypothetical protein
MAVCAEMLTGIFASVGILLAQLNVWRQPYSNQATKRDFQPLFHMSGAGKERLNGEEFFMPECTF